MTDYKNLVEALRHCSEADDACATCQRWLANDEWGIKCKGRLISDAAAAIEALNRLLDQNTQRCEALRKQLREAHESYEKHLNELKAQLPKRGKWVRVENGESYHYECSECGERPLYSRYGDVVLSGVCPMCGAKMTEVQDGE